MKNEELEVNNELPNGWAYAGLEDISDVDRHSIKRGPFGSALKKEFFVPDGYKVYEQGNVINNDFNRGTYFINDEKFEDLKSFSIKPKDILMSCAGTVGKLAIVPDRVQEGVINQALLKLSVHPDIDLQYFFKLFTYQIDEILKSNLRGSAMMNLTSVKDLKLVKFPIAPLNEQKRIVAKIEKLFSNLDNSDKYLLHLEKQLKRYRQSVLKSAFEGELTKEWRSINKFSYDDWKNQTILEIADKIFAGGDKPDKVSDTKTEECPYPIYSNGLQDKGLYGYTNIYKVEEECITISARGTIGFPLVRNERFVPIVRLIVVIPKDYIFSKYLKYYLESKIVVQSGSSIPQLTVPMVKQIEILVPQLEEQQEIVNQIEKHFSIIDKLENVVQKSINESKRLRQSILKQAFEGKLVEQDSNDESAGILLEKIAKAKEEYLKAQKKQARKK
ncbi:restriction endonuclease subunit S [Aliarcobacter cryaerophilus]|uniref:Type I restriction endonuclease n=1 Tax=Aliarcobacter cryaerophilus TaxID=28198 RepID=A0A2S9SK87_9BACT|nr:restriction endonuclease subunit S [Aliarcobacter cryaerophilus]PRM87008.1 type I restriction endonuclease [Aliarcobacter cryaerophilus]